MLCGNVGKKTDEELMFHIGSRGEWTAPAEIDDLPLDERTLYLFANDIPSKYDNNVALDRDEGGPLKVTIYRLPRI